MSSAPTATEASALEEVKQQFKTWRKTRTGRERIPASLWQAAAEVFESGDHSLHSISKTLHLNQTALKKYVQQQLPRSIKVKSEETPSFIAFELDSPLLVSECVIEMEDTTGAKMRMCLRGNTDPSILEICKSFWR
jgi:predicted transcriptional regulator